MSEPLPHLRPIRLCQARIGEKRCGKRAAVIRDTEPRFICAACVARLDAESRPI